MKMRGWIWFAAVFLLGCIGARPAAAQSGTTYQNGRNITCASDDGRRHYCPINTRGYANMVNQRSGSPCVQGRTWGYDRGGIWVDRGCRADFVVGGRDNGYNPPPPGYRPPPPPPPNGIITCSSNNGGRNFCGAYTGRGIRLVYQRSGSPCVQGQTWGYNNRGIWVDRGCRADFAPYR